MSKIINTLWINRGLKGKIGVGFGGFILVAAVISAATAEPESEVAEAATTTTEVEEPTTAEAPVEETTTTEAPTTTERETYLVTCLDGTELNVFVDAYADEEEGYEQSCGALDELFEEATTTTEELEIDPDQLGALVALDNMVSRGYREEMQDLDIDQTILLGNAVCTDAATYADDEGNSFAFSMLLQFDSNNIIDWEQSADVAFSLDAFCNGERARLGLD